MVTQHRERQEMEPGKLLGIFVPQAIYSSVCQVGQRESKTLQMVKDGRPVCYVLQETPQCEQASFPYFSGIRLGEKIPGTG